MVEASSVEGRIDPVSQAKEKRSESWRQVKEGVKGVFGGTAEIWRGRFDKAKNLVSEKATAFREKVGYAVETGRKRLEAVGTAVQTKYQELGSKWRDNRESAAVTRAQEADLRLAEKMKKILNLEQKIADYTENLALAKEKEQAALEGYKGLTEDDKNELSGVYRRHQRLFQRRIDETQSHLDQANSERELAQQRQKDLQEKAREKQEKAISSKNKLQDLRNRLSGRSSGVEATPAATTETSTVVPTNSAETVTTSAAETVDVSPAEVSETNASAEVPLETGAPTSSEGDPYSQDTSTYD